MGMVKGFEALAKDPELTGRHYRVLHLIMARATWENYLLLSQADIARELGIPRSNVNAAMKVPPAGPIGLEGDRGQMEYRRLRVQLLP